MFYKLKMTYPVCFLRKTVVPWSGPRGEKGEEKAEREVNRSHNNGMPKTIKLTGNKQQQQENNNKQQ